jgi:ribonuclease BN (tRNA processing enzyme)
MANFSSLLLPVESTTKVFLSHLHADHIGDIPGLLEGLRSSAGSTRWRSGAAAATTPSWDWPRS